jgi:hypothetical protein
MAGRWVLWLVLAAVVAFWITGARGETPVGATAAGSHGAVHAANNAALVVAADPRPGQSQDAGALAGLTGYVLGLGLVLTMIALVGLRACERHPGGPPLRRHRRF